MLQLNMLWPCDLELITNTNILMQYFEFTPFFFNITHSTVATIETTKTFVSNQFNNQILLNLHDQRTCQASILFLFCPFELICYNVSQTSYFITKLSYVQFVTSMLHDLFLYIFPHFIPFSPKLDGSHCYTGALATAALWTVICILR